MLSLFLSPFVVINITASYVSLNVVESETFQNKRNEEVGWRGNFNMKADFLMLRKKRKLKRRRASIYPLLKLHLYFTEATEDRLLYFLLRFSNSTCLS